MSAQPKGWVGATLGEIAAWGSGGTPSRSEPHYYGGGIPWVKTGELGPRLVTATEETISEAGLANSSAKIFPSGSVAIAMYGATIGKTSILGIPASTNQACAVGTPHPEITGNAYLYHFLCSQKEAFAEAGKGGAQPNISQAVIKGWPVPVAPLPEQKRIADKLDTVLARVGACRDRLDRLPALLKRFRQSILAAATSGRLTEDWRTNQTNRAPGKALKDLEARERAKENSVKVRGASIAVEPDLLFPLPSTWAWVENHRLAADEQNSICAGPFGTIFKAKDFRTSGVPIIFLRHIGAGRYLTHKPTFMDEDVWKEHHQPYSIRGGELLVTKLGDPPGSACIYPNDSGTAMVTPDVIKMSVDKLVSRPEYLMAYFNSPASKKVVEAACFGVTRLRIDLSLFKTFPIPLPPLEEQHEIVRRVDILFDFSDRLEARLATARQQVDQLTPALLAKAFRGELVAQDPADEPAAELLKRLAASRAAAPPAKRGRKAVPAN